MIAFPNALCNHPPDTKCSFIYFTTASKRNARASHSQEKPLLPKSPIFTGLCLIYFCWARRPTRSSRGQSVLCGEQMTRCYGGLRCNRPAGAARPDQEARRPGGVFSQARPILPGKGCAHPPDLVAYPTHPGPAVQFGAPPMPVKRRGVDGRRLSQTTTPPRLRCAPSLASPRRQPPVSSACGCTCPSRTR